MNLAIPTIHMNGTSRDALIEQLCGADEAIQNAIAALQQAAPNGRDYYPQGSEALSEAVSQHRARLQRLESVLAEVQEISRALP